MSGAISRRSLLTAARTLESNQQPRFNSAESASKPTKMTAAGVDWPDAPRFRLESSYEEDFRCPAATGLDRSVGPVGCAQRRRRTRPERDHHPQPDHGSPRSRHSRQHHVGREVHCHRAVDAEGQLYLRRQLRQGRRHLPHRHGLEQRPHSSASKAAASASRPADRPATWC